MPSNTASVRERLDALDGVEQVFIDSEIHEICLVLRADVDPHEM